VKFSPENPEEFGHIPEQNLSSFDHDVTSPAKGH
jgi:hypothetical protein